MYPTDIVDIVEKQIHSSCTAPGWWGTGTCIAKYLVSSHWEQRVKRWKRWTSRLLDRTGHHLHVSSTVSFCPRESHHWKWGAGSKHLVSGNAAKTVQWKRGPCSLLTRTWRQKDGQLGYVWSRVGASIAPCISSDATHQPGGQNWNHSLGFKNTSFGILKTLHLGSWRSIHIIHKPCLETFPKTICGHEQSQQNGLSENQKSQKLGIRFVSCQIPRKSNTIKTIVGSISKIGP